MNLQLPEGAAGIAGYQQYLDNATTASGAAQNLLIDEDGNAREAPSADAIESAANYGDFSRTSGDRRSRCR